MSLLSIITPSFNSEKTIERTLKSVLMQDFKDYEYWIIDGGSTDSTCNIIKKYEALFEGKLQWLSEPDKGIYDAFNKGITKSTGNYIWIVNSDDWVEPLAFTVIAKIIQSYQNKDEYPVISGAMNFCTKDGVKIRISKSSKERAAYCYKCDAMGVTHPATIVPRWIYEKYGSFDCNFHIIGDLDWFHRIYVQNVPILFIDDILTNMSDGGISHHFDYSKYARDYWLFLNRKYHNLLICYFKFLRWTLYFYKVKTRGGY